MTRDPEAWVSYISAHRRVEMKRGKAREYECVDCGGPAEQWSYTGHAENEFTQGNLHYSGDPADYAPRCRHCHAVYDGKALV